MAKINVTYVVDLVEDAEHTEDQKVEEVSQLIRDQVDAIRRVYDEGVTVTGKLKISDTDENDL